MQEVEMRLEQHSRSQSRSQQPEVLTELNAWILASVRMTVPFPMHSPARRAGESQHPPAILVSAMDSQPCVYIVTNHRYGTLYVGVTSNLPKRIWQHKSKVVDGFTKKYSLDRLVWYEVHESMISAIQREKAI